MNPDYSISRDFSNFKATCTRLQKMTPKSHIEIENSFPIVVEGEREDDFKVINQTIGFLEESACSSRKHLRNVVKTLCALRGVYSAKEEIAKDFDSAIQRIKSIKAKQFSSPIKVSEIRENGLYSDFAFLCQKGERVPAHLCILHQALFKEYTGRWKFIEDRVFDTKEFPKAAVDIVLDLVYNGSLKENISTENLLWAYSLASEFRRDDIKKMLEKAFETHLKQDSDRLVQGLRLICHELEKSFGVSEEGEKEKEREQNRDISQLSPILLSLPLLQKGFFYNYKRWSVETLQEVVKFLSPRATNNHFFVQYCLGLLYSEGLGIEKDEMVAFALIQAAAIQGYAPAQYMLGLFYENGIGIEKDEEQAFLLYQKAAHLGYSDAQFHLGVCYKKGIGVEANLEKVIHYVELAANQGNSHALFCLSVYYHMGMGVEVDLKKAFHYLELAADLGNIQALFSLSLYYQIGIGTEIDLKKAFHYAKLVADLGHSLARYNISTYYQRGIGTKIDAEKAFHYAELAADVGHVEAQINLSLYYRTGGGVEVNLERALHYAQLAADQGDAKARYNLSYHYEKGIGTEIDLKNAIYYCQLAAGQGLEEAQTKLSRLIALSQQS